jgi:1-acyl-sn-glycerol-3-phosphate acyltransferase
MSEGGDRPAQTPSRVVPLRLRTGARRVPPLLSAGEVARRLAALERQVEGALGTERVGRGTMALEELLEDALGAWVRGRSWLAGQTAGLSSTVLGDASLTALRRLWWRVDVIGRERLPDAPALVVANRGSALLPYEAFMAAIALSDGQRVRRTHPFVDEWLMGVPVLRSVLESLGGQAVSPGRVRRVLDAGESALVFPEGRDAIARRYAESYRVGRFSRTGVLRLAIERGIPIVPVGIIGVDEVHPVVARIPLPRALSLFGLPAVPVTPTLVPLPTKWTLFVGDPFDTAARHRREDARNPQVVRSVAVQVRERLQGLVSDGLRRRRSIF